MHADFPYPDSADELTHGFWQAAGLRELAIPRCTRCSHWVWYPAERCDRCSNGDLRWTPTSGRGTLYSWSVVERLLLPEYAGLVPYVSALVALDEDPCVRIVTRIVDADPATLVADMPVQVVFRPLQFANLTRPVLAPFFVPAVVGSAVAGTEQ